MNMRINQLVKMYRHFGIDMRADFKIEVNGKDITSRINKDTISIVFKDESGTIYDEITLNISGAFKKPKFEDEIKLWLGEEKDLFYCGIFKVQNPTQEYGTKEQMKITATGTDFSSNLKVKRNQSYEYVSASSIVELIAKRHKLEVVCDLDDIYVMHQEQTNESDLHFLKRFAGYYNALFSIKNNKIIFKKRIKNGKKSDALPRYKISKDECATVSIENINKTFYRSCKAVWHDTKENKQMSVTVGSGDPVKMIKNSFESVADAKLKADATLQKAQSGTKVGSITKYGQTIYAGGIIELTDTADDDTEYEIQSVQHTLDDSGWNISVDIQN